MPIVIPAALGLVFVTIPAAGLIARAPWSDLPGVARGAGLGTALRLSLVSSLLAMGLALTLGAPLGWVLARVAFPGRSLVRALALIPLALPPVVAGLALVTAFGPSGLLGAPLEGVGVELPGTLGAVVLAQAFVALPFVILAVEGGVRGVDREHEQIAGTLGASRWTVARRVTLPLAGPSLVAGASLAWARALGEFGATITFAGSIEGRTQTLPLAVYDVLERDRDGAVLLAVVLLAVSVGVIAVFRGALTLRSGP